MMSARVAYRPPGPFVTEICFCLRLSILMNAGTLRINTVKSGVLTIDSSSLILTPMVCQS